MKVQVRAFEQPELFPRLILRLSLARDVEEAQNTLLYLKENEEEEAAN